MYSLYQSSPPSTEPVSVALLKQHLRIYTPNEDQLLAMYITTARSLVEEWTQRQLMTSTWVLYLDHWFGHGHGYAYNPIGSMYMPVDYWPNENWNHKEILLPKAPTQSVTSVQYYDTDDTLQTLPTSGYAVDTTRQPARIVLEDYPSLSTDKYPRVQITYVSGYTTVPTQLCHAILLLAADFYRCREARTEYRFSDLPLGFQGLIQTYRLHVLDYQL